MPHAADDATTGVPQAADGNVFGVMHARSAVTMNPVWIPNTFGHALIAATTHMWHAVLTHRIPAVTPLVCGMHRIPPYVNKEPLAKSELS